MFSSCEFIHKWLQLQLIKYFLTSSEWRQWESGEKLRKLREEEDEDNDSHYIESILICPASKLEVGEGGPLVIVGHHHSGHHITHWLHGEWRWHHHSEGSWEQSEDDDNVNDDDNDNDNVYSHVDPDDRRLNDDSEIVL